MYTLPTGILKCRNLYLFYAFFCDHIRSHRKAILLNDIAVHCLFNENFEQLFSSQVNVFEQELIILRAVIIM